MKYILLVLSVFCSYLGYSQNCNHRLRGSVIDFHANTPLEDATIKLKNTDKITISDKNGIFNFEDLCEGTYTIEVSHIGCKTITKTVKVKGKTSVTITLEHHLEELDEVNVSGKSKTKVTSVEQSISKEVIEVYTDKSLGDALNTISGVSSLNTGNSIVKPMIHGLHSSRLLIINNNVRQFDQEWGDEHAPSIDINSGGQIEVIKGANTLIYGSDAIGGLILIKPENYALRDSLFGSTSLSLNSNGLGGIINSELTKTYKSGFYSRLQANYKRFGDFNAADYDLTNSDIESINASARFGYKSFEKGFDAYYSYVNNTIGILSTAHLGNVNNLVRAINTSQPIFVGDFSYDINNPKQLITHHLGKVEAYKRFQGIGKLSLQYDFQINRRREFDRRRQNFRDDPAADFRLFTTSLQPNLRIDAFDDLVVNTGLLVRYQQNDAAGFEVTNISIPLIPDYDKYDAGIYFTGNYSLNLNTEISAGFRYDFSRIEAEKEYKLADWEENNYDELFPQFSSGMVEDFEILTFPEFDFHNISSSLGITRYFENDIQFIFNYGLASRMPNVAELFSDGLHHSAARIETGNLTLNKEVANKFILSLERNNQNFGFTVSPYYKYINDFIQLIPSGEVSESIRGSFVKWNYDQVNAHIFGIDIDVNKKLSQHFDYSGSLSVLRGDNLTEDLPLIHMPSANFSNSISYKNENLNQLSLSLTQYTELRQNRFPDYNFTTFDPILLEDVYVDISTPTDAFTLFHFNSSVRFKISDRSHLNVSFNVENVFNTSYRNYLNRFRYFADDLGRNVNLKLKFNY
ncbi:MAG: TonB-dependent receptor [Winogradskyella sp.]|uniref:TonB-dependent receptor n=1 Tax=Winogradskyella sp. TaxID=1883156 RepID=UPI0025D00FE5|nr:TonB-dependent receptor [Winogradskyella sp.]NRB58989.1 TonB-dependent receptor [Winogradskyella sp.]